MQTKYHQEVYERWGNTHAYAEYSEKVNNYDKDKFAESEYELDCVFAEFAQLKSQNFCCDSAEAQGLVGKLKHTVTKNFYTCTPEILKGLGIMYVSDERFKNNIDKHLSGTAEYVSSAISVFCNSLKISE